VSESSPADSTSPDPQADQVCLRFVLSASATTDLLASHLGNTFEVAPQSSQKELLSLHDTYVWTLWFEGLALIKSRTSLDLFQRDGEWLTGPSLATIPLKGRCPRFIRNFPPSSLKDQLDDHIDCRALREVASSRWLSHEWNLLNKSAKTVVRLRILQELEKDVPSTFVEILPLRGYDEEATEVSGLLATVAEPATTGPLGTTLRDAAVTPVPYVLKPELNFAPDLGTRAAVCQAALQTLTIARSTETGMINDWDSEFLHDYRVSLRRIRSALSSIKGIFPEEKLSAWKETLGKISRHTNQLRDLDVYLLSEDEMTGLLPAELRSDLAAFFADLARERKSEFRKLRSYLQSSTYASLMKSLEEAFAHPELLPETAHSESPIVEEAAKRIAKRFRKLCRLADVLDKDSPDEDIHTIRIAGKKLRYLLEFFGGLFPEEEIGVLASQLSKLQSRLGQFNDTSVQQKYLLNYTTSKAHGLNPKLAVSLGGLIGALYQEHGTLKREIRQAIKKFCSEASVDVVKDFLEKKEETPQA